jgi:hypothetical protein
MLDRAFLLDHRSGQRIGWQIDRDEVPRETFENGTLQAGLIIVSVSQLF